MVQRSKSEASWGILGGFPGILGAIAFGLVFSFGLGNGLPLHIIGRIFPATLQRDRMIYDVPGTFPRGFPRRRTGMVEPKLMLSPISPQYPAMVVPDAGFTPSGSEARKDKQ